MLYYSLIFLLSCFAIGIMAVLVSENGRLDNSVKRRFYQTYAAVVLSSFTEWAAVMLNGAPKWTLYLHIFVKALDYIVTPMAGIFLAMQVTEGKSHKKLMWGLVSANAVFELISMFTGWTFYVDSDNFYHHGTYHFIYMLVYISVIFIILREFWIYGKSFEKRNKMSLFSIVFFVCLSIVLQETTSSDVRTATLGLTFGSILLFIHFSEFSQIENDRAMQMQQSLLRTDSLTGMLSRYAYHELLEEYSDKKSIPSKLIVFSIDANGLKGINDNYGHNEGDKFIVAAAECIKDVFGSYGKCFRTGGDEFVVITDKYQSSPEILQKKLKNAVYEFKTESPWKLSLSSGWAAAKHYAGSSVEKLVNIADQNMYADKKEYYRITGKERSRYRA